MPDILSKLLCKFSKHQWVRTHPLPKYRWMERGYDIHCVSCGKKDYIKYENRVPHTNEEWLEWQRDMLELENKKERELKKNVINLVNQKKRVSEIAKELRISEETVWNIIRNVSTNNYKN